MKKNHYNYLIIIFLLTLLILYLFNSQFIIYHVLNYTKLFIKTLFPASFVFFILSSLLLDYNFPKIISRLFHVDGIVFYVFIMSIISGFPSGSKYIKDLYNRNLITDKTANYLITFTHFPNPIFILGPVSSLFNNKLYGFFIFISIILSNIIISFLNKPCTIEKQNNIYNNNYKSFSNNLSKAIYSSLKTILLIYGTSLFFYLIVTIITKYIHFNLFGLIFFNGLFDLTKGIFMTSIINNDIYKAIFILFFLSFGGLAINMQVKSIISDTNIKYYYFIFYRVIQFIFSIVIFMLLESWRYYIY